MRALDERNLCDMCDVVEYLLSYYLAGGAKARLFVLKALAPLTSVDLYAANGPPPPKPMLPPKAYGELRRRADSISHSLAKRSDDEEK